MKKIILILLLQFQFGFAQSDNYSEASDSLSHNDSAKTFTINILSNLDDSKIFFDTNFIGMTPLVNYNIKEGFYRIRIFNPKSIKNWENENESVDIYINKDTTIKTNFRYYYFFNSTPFDADVFKNDSLYGKTPLRFFSDNPVSGNLIFKKKNYKNYIYDLKNYDFETGANILLKPKGLETVNDLVYKNRVTQFKTKRALIPIISLAAASLAGGYLAINFKTKANNAYNNYLIDGSASNLNTSRSNDTNFAFSLILMQAAIAGLIYFLFFDK